MKNQPPLFDEDDDIVIPAPRASDDEPWAGSYSVTFKGDGAPWVVVRAPNAAVLTNLLDDFEATALAGRVLDLSGEFKRDYKATSNGDSASADRTANRGRPGGATRSSGGSQYCQHGERVLKSGMKNGKRWSGQFCPDNECDPVWGN